MQPKTWLWKRVITNRKAQMVFDLTRCAVPLSPASPTRRRVAGVVPPRPQQRGSSLQAKRGEWVALPSPYRTKFFLSQRLRRDFLSLSCTSPDISLARLTRDRKHMLTISKIDHCGIKINYRNVETLMQAFWSSGLFLCNAERVIKHHFP